MTAPAPERVKGRRRPALIAGGAVLVVVFGLLGAWLATVGRDTQSVVVIVADVAAGAQIQTSDLATTDLTKTTGVATVPAEQIGDIVGQYASGPLAAGSLLNPAMVTQRLAPTEGEAIIGIGLTPSQLPSTGLQGGDQVTLIVTWSNQGTLDGESAPRPLESAWPATVVAVGPSNDDQTRTVDFALSSEDARAAAAAAGLGSIAVVLDQSVAGE